MWVYRTLSNAIRLARAASVSVATVWSAPLAAQEVFGILRGGPIRAPVTGVVVTATRVDDGTVVGRSVTGSAGTFRLLLPSDSVTVRALRIGQRPVVLFTGLVPDGEALDLTRDLVDEPVMVAAVRVSEPPRCGVPQGDGSTTLALFADAAAALAASVGVMDDAVPVVRTFTFELARDRRDSVRSASRPVVREDVTLEPFRSVPLPTLLRDGFVNTDARGDRVFNAPDAIVLTNERFLASTCLSLDDSRTSEGRVGIRFAPARPTRGRVDVQGVLWLDAESRLLERVEFGYVGLDDASVSVRPGGAVEYARLPDGRWLLDRWVLRMPVLRTEEVDRQPRGFVPQTLAVGVTERHGVVTDVRVDDRVLYTVGGPSGERAVLRSLHGQLSVSAAAAIAGSSPGSARLADAVASVGAARYCDADGTARPLALTVLVTDERRAPRAGMHVEAAWRGAFVRDADAGARWERARRRGITSADGTVVLCEVARGVAVEVSVTAIDCAPVQVVLRPAELATLGEMEVTLPAACRE